MKLPVWGSALGATLLVQVVSSFAAAVIPLLGPLLTLRWGLTPESIGYVSAVVSVGICWFLACGNPMLDHYGPARALQIGLFSIAAGLVLLSQPFSLLGLAGALLVGLGLAPNTPAGSQILMRTAPPAHRTLVFSIKQAGVPLGGAIAGVVVAPMVLGLGFAGTIWAMTAIVLASAMLVRAFRASLDLEKGPRNPAWARMFLSPSSLTRSARVLGSHASLPMLAALGVSFSMTQACVNAFTATYMVTQHGKTLAEAGHLVATLLVASTFSRIFLGWLADRLGGGLRLLCVLAPVTGTAIALMIAAGGAPAWLLHLCMALIGATAMGWNGVHMAELARVSPPTLIGDVTSGASLFGFAGSICGPLIFAVIAHWTGGFDWPFLLVAGQIAASGAFALWYLTRRLRRD
ncbi:MFS transporter [Bosea sp. (in: a-proteobacteria)]|uniref:MFS transporter n=1 Tax=Bosea sp. (in: a-proteobacteria) TaxID=1871050 RepID=UPI0026247540|nr:MFS transporter [Bosea sp. (in: a-proteobacteria)]MCO5089965.1 MFS transporter [Bosea sp. (in: a-proteobacteria)]